MGSPGMPALILKNSAEKALMSLGLARITACSERERESERAGKQASDDGASMAFNVFFFLS